VASRNQRSPKWATLVLSRDPAAAGFGRFVSPLARTLSTLGTGTPARRGKETGSYNRSESKVQGKVYEYWIVPMTDRSVGGTRD
jgi:hypothetical protein